MYSIKKKKKKHLILFSGHDRQCWREYTAIKALRSRVID
jgi:hypothetical protein